MSTTQETVGKNLRRIRQENNMSLRSLAKKLDVTEPMINRYETGKANLSHKRIDVIIEIFDISVLELYK